MFLKLIQYSRPSRPAGLADGADRTIAQVRQALTAIREAEAAAQAVLTRLERARGDLRKRPEDVSGPVKVKLLQK